MFQRVACSLGRGWLITAVGPGMAARTSGAAVPLILTVGLFGLPTGWMGCFF